MELYFSYFYNGPSMKLFTWIFILFTKNRKLESYFRKIKQRNFPDQGWDSPSCTITFSPDIEFFNKKDVSLIRFRFRWSFLLKFSNTHCEYENCIILNFCPTQNPSIIIKADKTDNLSSLVILSYLVRCIITALKLVLVKCYDNKMVKATLQLFHPLALGG